MAENTLSPVGFDRPVVKTICAAQERHALAMLRAELDVNGFKTTRHVLLAGLEALGWGEARRIDEYATYKISCLESGRPNEFEDR
jgi:hypothetical protein